LGSGILGSGLIRVKLRRVEIGSVLKRVGYGSNMGCPFSVHFGLGHYGSGMTWVESFREWVISGVDQFRVSFGYGSVYVGCSGPIGSAHFGCRFGYGSGSIDSGFGFRVSFARSSSHTQVGYRSSHGSRAPLWLFANHQQPP